jgi:hypothetical protein
MEELKTLEQRKEEYLKALNDCMVQQYRIEGALGLLDTLIKES